MTKLTSGKGVKRTCPICSKEIGEQGYGGHMFGVHNIRVGIKATLLETSDLLTKLKPLLQEVPDLRNKYAALEKALKFFEGSDWLKSSDGKIYLGKKG